MHTLGRPPRLLETTTMPHHRRQLHTVNYIDSQSIASSGTARDRVRSVAARQPFSDRTRKAGNGSTCWAAGAPRPVALARQPVHRNAAARTELWFRGTGFRGAGFRRPVVSRRGHVFAGRLSLKGRGHRRKQGKATMVAIR